MEPQDILSKQWLSEGRSRAVGAWLSVIQQHPFACSVKPHHKLIRTDSQPTIRSNTAFLHITLHGLGRMIILLMLYRASSASKASQEETRGEKVWDGHWYIRLSRIFVRFSFNFFKFDARVFFVRAHPSPCIS